MTAHDDELTPKLGRIRTRGSLRGRRYLHQVLQAAALAGGNTAGKVSSFHGNRIGRGAGIGRVLAMRDRLRGFRSRRVIVKSRIVKLAGRGLKAAHLHLRYLQRDGVMPDGSPGQLYDTGRDHVDGRAFRERAQGDRHQFRFIVSAEDGDQYGDLKPLVRRLMVQMERDLGTRLDWVAVDHHNTGHPHSHIVLRGRDDRGRDLVIARDYLSRGMRERAAAIVSLDLGPRTDREIADRLSQQVEQDRLTDLDRDLQRRLRPDGLIAAHGIEDAHRVRLAGRLQKLQRLGLAEETTSGRWQLAGDLELTLRRLGERGDIIKTMHRELRAAGLSRGLADFVIHDPATNQPLLGRVIARGQSDELGDRHYLVLDGTDGRVHFVEVGEDASFERVPQDGLVAVSSRTMAARPADRTIAGIADANGGLYDAERHRRFDPTASADYIQTHIRRLEALRRGAGLAARRPDGVWEIAPDYLTRVRRLETRRQAMAVQVLSEGRLESLVNALGVTWLDRQLVSGGPVRYRDSGYGRTVGKALAARQHWLVAEGYAWREGESVRYSGDLLETLRKREIRKVAGVLEQELGKSHRDARPGERVTGICERRIALVSGSYAVIVGAQDFSLVPWRPVFERSLGQSVSGTVREKIISWTVGRGRGGPILS